MQYQEAIARTTLKIQNCVLTRTAKNFEATSGLIIPPPGTFSPLGITVTRFGFPPELSMFENYSKLFKNKKRHVL